MEQDHIGRQLHSYHSIFTAVSIHSTKGTPIGTVGIPGVELWLKGDGLEIDVRADNDKPS
jgi:quinol-cytochrome oxidoreductase complex cytochrome b subunit